MTLAAPAARPRCSAVVALGGAVGALLRYGLSEAFPDPADGFPWTIFAVNVVGCFAARPAAGLPRRTAARARCRRCWAPVSWAGSPPCRRTPSRRGRWSDAGHDLLAAGYVVGTLAACLLAVAVADRFSTVLSRLEFLAEEGDL